MLWPYDDTTTHGQQMTERVVCSGHVVIPTAKALAGVEVDFMLAASANPAPQQCIEACSAHPRSAAVSQTRIGVLHAASCQLRQTCFQVVFEGALES